MVSLGISAVGCRMGYWHAEAKKDCWACLRSHRKLAGGGRDWILRLLNPNAVPGAGSPACTRVTLAKVHFPSAGVVGQESTGQPWSTPGSAQDALVVAMCPTWNQLHA